MFAKQASFGGLNAAATSEGEGGGMPDARNENIGVEGGELLTEGIFTLSCRGEVEKVR